MAIEVERGRSEGGIRLKTTGKLKGQSSDIANHGERLQGVDSPANGQWQHPPRPWFPIGLGMVQSMLTTVKPAHTAAMSENSRPLIIDAGPDAWGTDSRVAMLAYFTPATHMAAQEEADWADRQNRVPQNVHSGLRPAKGVAILLHGWEGSSHSNFNLILGSHLSEQGYHVVRLNLRDHGPVFNIDPAVLNPGLFLATLLDEVQRAIVAIGELFPDLPLSVIGPSMGGNFVLRLAAGYGWEELPQLRHMIAVSPVLDGGASIDLIDRNLPILRYFRNRWLATLARKQRAFPELYDFRGIERLNLLRPMTEWLVQRYTDFADTDEYFGRYSFLGEDARTLSIPTTILTAADDPIIPMAEIEALADSPLLIRRIVPWGGHVGFISWPPLRHQIPAMVEQVLSAAA